MFLGVSTFLAFLGLVYCIGYPFVVYQLLANGDLDDDVFRSLYEGLFEVYKEDSIRTVTFEAVVFAKKFLMAVIFVFCG